MTGRAITLNAVAKSYGGRRVLDNITAKFETSRSTGVLGENGSGKSTLLRLVAGVEPPDRGAIDAPVSVSWPLAFGGGFHPAMTGRENVHFVARLYGAEPRTAAEETESFAEIGRAFDEPVQIYSTGMQARLAFALSMAIDFDFLLVDEVLAVGDARFQARCARAIADRRARGGMLFVSHSLGLIQEHCDSGVILSGGRLTAFADVKDAIAAYRRAA